MTHDRLPPGRSALETAVGKIVDDSFAAECDFLAALVKVPTDNPPGDCAAHAERARALLEALGFTVEAHPVPVDSVRAAGMISATISSFGTASARTDRALHSMRTATWYRPVWD